MNMLAAHSLRWRYAMRSSSVAAADVTAGWRLSELLNVMTDDRRLDMLNATSLKLHPHQSSPALANAKRITATV